MNKAKEYQIIFKNNELKLDVVKEFERFKDYPKIEIDECGIVVFLIEEYQTDISPIEKAFVLSFDNQNCFNGIMQVGIGDNNTVHIPFSTSFKFLFLSNADSCIFVHTHPTGCTVEPSSEDLVFHYELQHLCNLLGIKLNANLIISGHEEYYDILENKKVMLEEEDFL